MKNLITIIKLDYLQRTRNYNFLVTLCASLAIAYTFVPEPNANYSTIRIGGYVGFYNAAWFGYVTAIMTSLFLSLIGFYLINSSIKNDTNSKIGEIIASTSISNLRYLFSKVISNYLLLLSITFCVFIMAILLFYLYNDGYNLQFTHFIKPYLIITLPALFFIASLAVAFEIIFKKYSVLQNIVFFFLFCFLLVYTPEKDGFYKDVFGSKIVINNIENTVKAITNTKETKSMNIGYVFGNTKKNKKFTFTGIDFKPVFILSRIIWMLIGALSIVIISKFFSRFSSLKKTRFKTNKQQVVNNKLSSDLDLSKIAKIKINYSILPLIKTEFVLLIRKGKKWLWLINILGMVLLVVLPSTTAHQIILPILWFLQVHRISDIATKETFYKTQLFSYSSYKPLQRIFAAKILASLLLMLVISIPLIIKYIISFNWIHTIAVILGFSLLVLFSIFLGLITKGKKLFEVTFFLVTYTNINGIPYTDYFGASYTKLTQFNIVIILILLFLISSVFLKKKSLQI